MQNRAESMNGCVEIKVNVLKLALALQISYLILFLLGFVGINIQIAKQLVGVLYTLLAVGALLFCTLFNHYQRDFASFMLFSVGLSFCFLTVMGLTLNFIGSYLADKPISQTPVLVITTVSFTVSYFFCYRYRKTSTILTIQLFKKSLPWVFFSLLLIFLGILSAYLVYYYGNILLASILIILIALLSFSCLSKKAQENYPLLIFSAALSLIYHHTLSYPLSLGGDDCYEYGFSNLVLTNGVWNPSLVVSPTNSVASVNILVPILCLLTGMNELQLFKIIIPIILSFLPLGLYLLLKDRIGHEYAFLSAYFYMSVGSFYKLLPGFVKQSLAMFLLILVVWLLLSNNRRERSATKIVLLAILFTMIIGYYGISYIFLFLLLSAQIFHQLLRSSEQKQSYINIFCYSFAVALAWYMYTSSGVTFDNLVTWGSHVAYNLDELFNPRKSDALTLILREKTLLSQKIRTGLYISTWLFIVFGLLLTIYKELKGKKGNNVGVKYLAFSAPSLALLVASLLPYVTSSGMGVTRVYSIALIFLAPFCIVGLAEILNFVRKRVQRLDVRKLIAIFFAAFLLFDSGLISEIMGESIMGSVALSQARIKSYGTPYEKATLYDVYFADEDIFSAKWLSEYRVSPFVSSDFYAFRVLVSYGMFIGKGGPHGKELLTPNSIEDLDKGTYIYLRKLNWKDGIMTKFSYEENWVWNTSVIISYLDDMNLIYSNGGSVIFLKD